MDPIKPHIYPSWCLPGIISNLPLTKVKCNQSHRAEENRTIKLAEILKVGNQREKSNRTGVLFCFFFLKLGSWQIWGFTFIGQDSKNSSRELLWRVWDLNRNLISDIAQMERCWHSTPAKEKNPWWISRRFLEMPKTQCTRSKAYTVGLRATPNRHILLKLKIKCPHDLYCQSEM